jgi:hypothetical protein
MSSDITRYVERLRSHLHLGEAAEAEFLREIEAHVEDRTNALVARGLPAARARRRALDGFGRPQTLAHLMRQASLRASWLDALLAAAPFVLLAALLGLGLWTQPWITLSAAVAVVGVTLYGLWSGRPAWFYPWAGVALTLPVFAGYIAFAVLGGQAPSVLAGDAPPYALAGVAGAALYFPVGVVVVAAAVLVAARRDWLDASMLLSPLPVVLAWIVELHRSGGVFGADAALGGPAPALAAVCLLAAVATAAFLLATTRTAKFATLVASAVLLISAATLLLDPSGGFIMIAARSALLLGFLLSPALVARHA